MNPQAVRFETGMRLKEKGFDVPTDYGYDGKGGYYQDETFKVNYNGDPYTDLVCSAPTIAEVVMWLYEKHGIWIDVTINQKIYRFISNIYKNYSYTCSMYGQTEERPENGWDNPTEAYEAAIKYTLEKLI